MALALYNSLTRCTQPFEPMEPGHVRMYVCGMTVYDHCHLGHARSMLAFDVLQRWLRASGLRVTYVRNITDIDDKIIRRALQNGEPIRALTDRMVAALEADAASLGIEPPTHTPRATEHVGGMLSLIERLRTRGLAYQGSNGDMLYAVRQFANYGRLSGKSPDELRAGERVAVAEGKADPLDFVLWKSAKPDEPADARWDSPYGPGRPGWHIECSAMCGALLGPTVDIHGGGADLQFPHHENEIAQSEGANGVPLARWWVHNGFVTRDDEKMSKSLGNFFTIRDILAQTDAQTLRFFIVRSHYRSALPYSDMHLADARAGLRRLYTALLGVDAPAGPIDWANPFASRFKAAMDDDLNTPEAVAVLFDLAAALNRSRAPAQAGLLRALGGVLGLLQGDPLSFLQQGVRVEIAVIEDLIAQRTAAKAARDWARADAIRQELLAQGVALKDGPDGTTWHAA